MFDEALYRSALAIRRAGLDLTITFKEDLHPRGFGGRWVKKHGQLFREAPAVPGPNTGIRSDFSESEPLRASDTLVNHSFGTTPGEGHFGTGVYFTSTPERTRGVSGHMRGIDLTGKRLWKPANENEAWRVHDALGEADELSATHQTEATWRGGRTVNPTTIAAKLPEGTTPEMVLNAIQAASADLDDGKLDEDTAGTRVMRALGFDGVDVRHLDDRIDNTMYGSVLYRPLTEMRPSPPPEVDYRGLHHAPGPENGAPMHALDSTDIYPPDIYTKPQFYVMPTAADEGMEKRSYEIAQSVRGQPDAMVPVYRAGPVGVLNTGDWVTPNEDYARLHSRDATDPSKDMPVWSFLVPASQLWTQGDSLNEYGFSGETLTAAPAPAPAPAPTLVPAAPGETPIPEGAIRIWHYTRLDNVPAIREQGLRRDLARGDDGSGQEQESKGVWASTKAPDDGALRQAAFIEGWVMPDQLSYNAEHYWNQDPLEWAKGYHHVILTGDLPPEQIAAIHEPWQQTFRYLMENYPDGEADGEDGVLGIWPDDADPGDNDYSMEITPAAIAYRKALGLPPVLKNSG